VPAARWRWWARRKDRTRITVCQPGPSVSFFAEGRLGFCALSNLVKISPSVREFLVAHGRGENRCEVVHLWRPERRPWPNRRVAVGRVVVVVGFSAIHILRRKAPPRILSLPHQLVFEKGNLSMGGGFFVWRACLSRWKKEQSGQ